jgi:hypothetical protein
MPTEMPIETFVLAVTAVAVAYLTTRGIHAIAKRLSKNQLGWLGFGCAIGFLATVGFILLTEPLGSRAITPPKVLLLTWVAAGNECFKLASEEA